MIYPSRLFLVHIFPLLPLYNDLSEALPLDGKWEFALGIPAPGQGSGWGEIQVPGCWEAQGFPKTIDGPARYRREIDIPIHWAGQRILLEFDAVSYACQVVVNGKVAGEHLGLWTPFTFDIPIWRTPANRTGSSWKSTSLEYITQCEPAWRDSCQT